MERPRCLMGGGEPRASDTRCGCSWGVWAESMALGPENPQGDMQEALGMSGDSRPLTGWGRC